MSAQKITFCRKDLENKALLNITESRFYINASRRLFDQLEKSDPSFPKRKTKTKHSRPLLDAWLHQNGSLFFENPTIKSYGERATRFALNLDQMN